MTSDKSANIKLPARTEAESVALELARQRTDMAAERTDFALIRTGFTASSFGAGLTQILGRGVWPSQAVDLLTILFILAGAMSVQIGLIRLLKRLRTEKGSLETGQAVRRMLVVGVSLLQVALFAIVVMVIIHM